MGHATWIAPPGPRKRVKGLSLRALRGKYLLVGVTVEDQQGNLIERFQVHGRVRSATRAEIVINTVPSGEPYSIPPDLTAIQPAPPGEYTLKPSGEVVQNPDFLSTWVLIRPTIH